MSDSPTSTQTRRRQASGIVRRDSSGDSWLSLLAATTPGLGSVRSIRAQIQAIVTGNSGPLRLVVQSYDPAQLTKGQLPAAGVRPLASLQRSISAEELARGLEVELVELGVTGAVVRPVLVAWVEPGYADLVFDALLARPSRDALLCVGKTRGHGDGLLAELALGAA